MEEDNKTYTYDEIDLMASKVSLGPAYDSCTGTEFENDVMSDIRGYINGQFQALYGLTHHTEETLRGLSEIDKKGHDIWHHGYYNILSLYRKWALDKNNEDTIIY